MPITDQDPQVEGFAADGTALTGNPVRVGGSDGANVRTLSTDSSGRPVVVGAGVAGTPAGGVASIQGVAGGTAVPISGSITATNAAIGTVGSAAPASASQSGGTDGTNLRAMVVDANGVLVGASLAYAIAIGRLTGVAGRFSGQVTGGTTGVAEVIRATTYTEQASNAQRSVNSTVAADASAGTGARTVRITYYSVSAGVVTGPFTETVTLNGTTAVNTASSTIAYIESIEVLTVGSGLVNAGIIQLFTTTAGGGSVFASIAVGLNNTMYAHHYVTSTRRAFLTDLMWSSTEATAQQPDFFLRSTDLSLTNAAERRVSDHMQAQGSSNAVTRALLTPLVVTGPARITAYIVPTANTASQVNQMEVGFYEV